MSTVLITGATGFVGSHLTDALRETDGVDVRVFVRDADGLDNPAGLDVVEGDLANGDDLGRALDAVDCAYYLVHSMEAGGGDFSDRDRELAEAFVAAADRADVGRIVYLGGIQPSGESSEHLDSRLEVERTLAKARADFVALRASMIIGADSASFRTLAQIVDRLPVLALPKWRDRSTQPVAIDDVVQALVAAADVPPDSYDIAGPDELTFEAMTEIIADLRGKAHRSVPLPFTSPKLEGAAAALITDADRELLTPIMAGLDEDLVIEDNALHTVFGVVPTPFREAAGQALAGIATTA
ncbi:NAD(P)H-binding protein [Paraconexibacter sp. AEG42_29]|uniref:NAD(P)H-binding protein n=1 Tax=Paraconexibacter sp. AEG42_29 TaxID=2997339 RepID=UPI00339D92EF